MNGFYVGQVVVCVDASNFPHEDDCGEFPVEGGVYTIRKFKMDEEKVGILVAEIVNPWYEWSCGNIGEIGFFLHRFRPAKKTSLAVFDAALKGLPLSVEEA